MKRFLIIAVILSVCFSPLLAQGEDSIEVLTLKRDFAQERVIRIQAEIELIKQRFAQWQAMLKQAQADLSIAEGQLKAVQPKEIKEDAAK